MNLEDQIKMTQRQQMAPEVVKKAKDECDVEDLAEVCAEVETTLRDASQERGLNKHHGIACLYMVVNRLADMEDAE